MDFEAKVSPKGQTTIPKVVRDALGIEGRGEIVFRVEGSRAVCAGRPTASISAESSSFQLRSPTWSGATSCAPLSSPGHGPALSADCRQSVGLVDRGAAHDARFAAATPGIERMKNTEVVVDGLAFPECPRWRARRALVLGPARRTDLADRAIRDGRGDGRGSRWAFGAWVVARRDIVGRLHAREEAVGGSRSVVPSSGTSADGAVLTVVADLEPYNPGLSNDMVVDAIGAATSATSA